MPTTHYFTAREAAAELDVSLATLYAYVSRGLIRSGSQGKARSQRHHLEDARLLKERKEQRKNPQKVAESALHWGAPVMESAISLIADGQLYYRGRNAVALAADCSIEQVAWLIWTGVLSEPPALLPRLALSPRWHAVRRAVADLAPFDAFQVLLPLAATDDLAAYDLRTPAVNQTGLRILQLLAAIAVGSEPSDRPISITVQQGWVPHDPDVASLINAALILCADHEFNVSSFTARCVASAGSTPYADTAAGLAALQGAKHSDHCARVDALLHEIATPQRAREVITSRLRRGESLPGFGRLLYPEADPRGAMLVRLATEARPASPVVGLANTVAREVLDVIGDYPTIDFGLVMLTQALCLPPGSAIALFAMGRTIGWIGHAIEQYQQDRMIRPRASYIGAAPVEP